MTPRDLAISLAAMGLLFAATPHALSAEEPLPIYGRQLMPQGEQERYRARMRALET